MPTLWAHRNYFNNSSTVVPPTLAASEAGYPLWQASGIAVGSLFGGLQAYWERLIWWLGLWGRRAEIERALEALAHPVEPPKPDIVQVFVPVKQKAKARPRVAKLLQWARKAKKQPAPVVPDVLQQADSLLHHPAYPFAQDAVRKTATTLGFNRPEAWQGLSRHMKSSPGRAENVFRHLEACRLTRETCGSTLTNPECNLLVELAYHDFALRGK